MEELNFASVKISELQKLIDKEKTKSFEHFKMLTSTLRSVLFTLQMFIVITFCSCCF